MEEGRIGLQADKRGEAGCNDTVVGCAHPGSLGAPVPTGRGAGAPGEAAAVYRLHSPSTTALLLELIAPLQFFL